MTGRSTHVRLGAALLLVLMFGAGAVMGAAAAHLRARPTEDPTDRMLITIESPTRLPKELMDLHLTAAQSRVVDSLLSQSRPKVDAVLRETAPRLQAIVDSTDVRVRAVLTPAQRAALDRSRRERQPIFLLQRRSDSGALRVDTLRRP